MSDTRDRMQEAAHAVESILPPGTGFVMLAFDFDKPGKGPSGRLDYISNAQRPDICRMMIDFIQRSAGNFAQHEVERLLTAHFEVDEGQRQLIVHALAQSALRNPGWNEAITDIVKLLGGEEMFNKFKELWSIKTNREPVAPDLVNLLQACVHGFQSYAMGNASPDLANSIIEKIDDRLLAQ